MDFIASFVEFADKGRGIASKIGSFLLVIFDVLSELHSFVSCCGSPFHFLFFPLTFVHSVLTCPGLSLQSPELANGAERAGEQAGIFVYTIQPQIPQFFVV